MIKRQSSFILLLIFLAGCAPEWRPSPRFNDDFFLSSQKTKTVRVRSGDSVYVISNRYGVSMRGIINSNQLQPPYILYPGQILTLPDTQVHLVKQGESLYVISRNYGIGVNALARQNKIAKPYLIFPGQMLTLPYFHTLSADTNMQSETSEQLTKFKTNADSKKPISVRKAPAIIKPQSVSGDGDFIWPVKGTVLSKFGPSGKGMHNDGINIAITKGSEVRAARYGTVVYSGNEIQGFGKLLLIKHSDGWMTAYAHNDSLLVARGDQVKQGQIISRSGNSGNVRMPQLHFELRQGTKAVDPLKYLGS